LLREGLKLIIEEETSAIVTIATDETSAPQLLSELAPGVIVIDRPDIKATGLDFLFQYQENPVRVMVVGWNDDKIANYTRSTAKAATLQNLIKIIKEK